MNKLLWLVLTGLIALPIAANAEVYKWIDKTGVTRYSDTPPPANVEQLPVNGKKPAGTPPNQRVIIGGEESSEGEEGAPAKIVAPPPTPAKKPASKDSDAAKRGEEAEIEKKKNEQKEAEMKQKQQNCANAKTNYSNYKVGGRMSRVNEKGEREYLGDADIAKGMEQAQKDIDQFCE